MSRTHKPVSGSRGFWPKKRAKRIYNRFSYHPPARNAVPLDFAGYKVGMTQVAFVDGRKGSPTMGQEIVQPATVLNCPSLSVAGIVLYGNAYQGSVSSGVIWSEKPPKDLERKTRLPKKHETRKGIQEAEKGIEDVSDVRLLVSTGPREGGGKKRPELFEVALGGDVKQKWEYVKQKLGKEIKADEVFKEGEFVDVRAVTKGKGFQGPVKRFGVKVRIRKAKKKRRHIGNLGPRQWARVRPGDKPMPGQLGFQTRTEYNKRILKIASGKLNPAGGWVNYGELDGSYMIVHGSIPGPRKRLVMLRKGARAPDRKDAVEVKHIALESQQG
ncbi:MAG: 50S ribosomal protein L3 [Candidatus Aenigmarchaeota archaeon]|nr:50S ribosomal protein L3 [Candidatus Aenigmarchaeota archaeon]